MAVFGVPFVSEDDGATDARRSCRAALQMVHQLCKFNHYRQERGEAEKFEKHFQRACLRHLKVLKKKNQTPVMSSGNAAYCSNFVTPIRVEEKRDLGKPIRTFRI